MTQTLECSFLPGIASSTWMHNLKFSEFAFLPSHSQTWVFLLFCRNLCPCEKVGAGSSDSTFFELGSLSPWCMKKAVCMNSDHRKESVWFLSFFSALALKLEPYQLQGKFVAFSMHHSFQCRLMFNLFFLILALKSWALAVLWQMYVSTWTISGRLRADSISLAGLSSFFGSFIQFPWFFLPAWPNSLSSHFATSQWWLGTGFYFLLLTPWYTILARVKQHHPLDAHYYSAVDEPQLS